MELCQVKRYWETHVELVSALKEDTASSLMAVHEIKMEVLEGIYVVDIKKTSTDEPKVMFFSGDYVEPIISLCIMSMPPGWI